MRAFYCLLKLIYTFLITCFQYTSTNVGEIWGGGLSPKPLMSAAYARDTKTRTKIKNPAPISFRHCAIM